MFPHGPLIFLSFLVCEFIEIKTYYNLSIFEFIAYSRVSRYNRASQVALVVKNLPVNAEDTGYVGLIPGSGRSPGGRNGNPLPVFVPGESHGQRSLAGYSHKVTKSRITEHVRTWLLVMSYNMCQSLSFLRWFVYLFIYLASLGSVGILVPPSVIEHVPPTLETWSLIHWTTRKFPQFLFLMYVFIYERSAAEVRGTSTHSSSNLY